MRFFITLLFSLSIFLSPVPASAAGLTSAQIQAILSLLSSFGADSSVIANVSLALTGSPTPTPSSSCSFTRDLTIGSSGADVSCLQKTLSDKGYTLAFGVTGFFGVQTQAAVIAWQQAVGISPASGYFGTLSRSTLTGTATTPTPSLKLSSLSPVSGPIGTTVTISGTGFTSSNNTLYVNNILAGAQISSSGSSLTFVIPAQLQGTCASYERLCLINNTVSSGSQAISIRNANGTSNSLTFTVVPPLLSSPVVCAADVSVCPDGSIVGRTGPSCAFACAAVSTSQPASSCNPNEVFGSASTDKDWVPFNSFSLFPTVPARGSGVGGTSIRFVPSSSLTPNGFYLRIVDESPRVVPKDIVVSSCSHNYKPANDNQGCIKKGAGSSGTIYVSYGKADKPYDCPLNPGQTYYINFRQYTEYGQYGDVSSQFSFEGR